MEKGLEPYGEEEWNMEEEGGGEGSDMEEYDFEDE